MSNTPAGCDVGILGQVKMVLGGTKVFLKGMLICQIATYVCTYICVYVRWDLGARHKHERRRMLRVATTRCMYDEILVSRPFPLRGMDVNFEDV